jgi:hypothetical protein
VDGNISWIYAKEGEAGRFAGTPVMDAFWLIYFVRPVE